MSRPEGALALADQLGQRQAGQPTQVLDDPAERAEPVEPGLGDPLAVRTAPRRRRQVVERLDDARPVGALRGLVADLAQRRMPHQARLVAPARGRVELPRLLEVLVGRGLQAGQLEDLRLARQRPGGPLLRPRPRREPVEVGRPEPAERSGEQPHQPVAARRVLDDPEQADQVVDLRGEQQPAEPDDLDGQVARLERLDDERELRPLPAQHGRAEVGPPPARRAPPARDPVGDVGRLVLGRLQPGRLHPPGAGVRTSAQRRDDLRPQRRRGGVGDVEDGVVVAPAGPQRQHLRLAALVGELPGEPGQRRRTGAAPAVDRLVRVADRGHADVAATRAGRPEQRPQHLQLGLRRVLELVEQHRPEPGPLRSPPMPGTGLRQPGRQRHLVAEVHRVAASA